MPMHSHQGGCHCGNITLRVQLTRASQEIRPRACDCSYCTRLGAAYVSDPAGSLAIAVADAALLGRYRQGSGVAQFLCCRRCGVMVAVVLAEAAPDPARGERLFATVNWRVLDSAADFAEALSVSPRSLSAEEKQTRWRKVWFDHVSLDIRT